jgi:hypothetical protein
MTLHVGGSQSLERQRRKVSSATSPGSARNSDCTPAPPQPAYDCRLDAMKAEAPARLRATPMGMPRSVVERPSCHSEMNRIDHSGGLLFLAQQPPRCSRTLRCTAHNFGCNRARSLPAPYHMPAPRRACFCRCGQMSPSVVPLQRASCRCTGG